MNAVVHHNICLRHSCYIAGAGLVEVRIYARSHKTLDGHMVTANFFY